MCGCISVPQWAGQVCFFAFQPPSALRKPPLFSFTTTDKGAYLNSIINNFNTITVKGKNSNILVANGKYIATMDQTGNITKGTEVNVVKPITYVPSNEQQQVFIFVVSTK